MYHDLHAFVAALEAQGELKRIRTRVSPVLDIAAIADRESKSPAPNPPSKSALAADPRFHSRGGKALLFENVEGSDIPVLINAWGSYRRMEMALGCHDPINSATMYSSSGSTSSSGGHSPGGHSPGGFATLAKKIADLTKPEPPKSFSDLFAKARQFLPLLKIPPKRRKGRGPCQERITLGDDIDLRSLPILRCWPNDGDLVAVGYPANINFSPTIPGVANDSAATPDWNRLHRGRYITLAGIHTIHADDINESRPSSHNIGMYRVQLFGPRTMSMHWHMHHDGARHWRSWKAKGQNMPVAIVLGGESVMPYAATAPLPPGISELLLAGFLNRSGIPMVRGVTVPLWIPANAEIVIEGFVRHDAGFIGWDPRDPNAGPLGPGAVFEGPFGDHTGFYSMPDRYPILEVTAITRRNNAIYPTTIVGLPPQEDYYLGKATERLFLPLLKTIVHDIEDYDLPQFGAFHNCACIRVKKAYPLQGRRVMHSIWGAGQMAWTKTIFVVDDDCNVHDTFQVLTNAGMFCNPARDIELARGPVDILDHSAPQLGAGLKLGFDCTRKSPAEAVQGVAVLTDASGKSTSREILPPETLDTYATSLAQLPNILEARALHETRGYWLVVRINKAAPGDGVRALEAIFALPHTNTSTDVNLPPFVIVLGQDVNIADADNALFHWVANFDASRDLVRHTALSLRLGFDATPKLSGETRQGEPIRPWPPIIEMPAEVIARTANINT